jgi:hypothetical protein
MKDPNLPKTMLGSCYYGKTGLILKLAGNFAYHSRGFKIIKNETPLFSKP